VTGTRRLPALGEQFNPHSNSLNSLRLLFAISVIFAHSYKLAGLPGMMPRLGDLDPGHFAVLAFFAASGYLITHSRERNSLMRFGWARFLRIYPAFWVCLIVTAFLFAGIAGAVGGGWSLTSALSYVVLNSTLHMRQYGIGNTLAFSPDPTHWDSPLWTLELEFGCYVMIGLFLTIKQFRRVRWVLGLFVLSTAAIALQQFEITHIPGGFIHNLLGLLPFFLAGAVTYKCGNVIPMSPILFALSFLIIVGAALAHCSAVVSPLAISYCVLYLAATLPPMIERIGDGSFDISYGVYIYGFPMQQLLVLGGLPHLGIGAMIAGSTALTIIPASVSWLVIEKPCLRLKNLSFANWRRLRGG